MKICILMGESQAPETAGSLHVLLGASLQLPRACVLACLYRLFRPAGSASAEHPCMPLRISQEAAACATVSACSIGASRLLSPDLKERSSAG